MKSSATSPAPVARLTSSESYHRRLEPDRRVEQSETYINDVVGSLLGELAECEKVVNLNDLGLRLLKIGVKYRDLVLEGGDLLFLLQQELLVFLVLGLGLLCARDRGVGLSAK